VTTTPQAALSIPRLRAELAGNVIYERGEDAAVHEAWVTGTAVALRQGDAGAYVNFLGEEGAERVRAAYPASTWDRLAAIKRRYDPGNLSA
jgi:hypothetical protein